MKYILFFIIIYTTHMNAITLNPINTSCPTCCDGSIDLIIQGGCPPHQFAWNNGANIQNVNDLCLGTYSVTVTDAEGCIATGSAIVNELNPPAVGCCWQCQGNELICNSDVSQAACPGDWNWVENGNCGDSQCGNCTENIPTLSQWGLILLTLLLLTLTSVVLIRQRQTTLNTINNEIHNTKLPYFNLNLFKNITLKSIPFMLIAFLLCSWADGGLFPRNVFGTIAAGLILAYLVHYVILSEGQKEE